MGLAAEGWLVMDRSAIQKRLAETEERIVLGQRQVAQATRAFPANKSCIIEGEENADQGNLARKLYHLLRLAG